MRIISSPLRFFYPQAFRLLFLCLPGIFSCSTSRAQGPPYYHFVNDLTGKVLDVAAPCTKAKTCKIQQWEANEEWRQQWSLGQIQGEEIGFVRIVNRATGRVLGMKVATGKDGTISAKCEIQKLNAKEKGQQWFLVNVENGGDKIVNRASNEVLEVVRASTSNGAAIQLAIFRGTKQQQWTMTTADAGPGPFFNPDDEPPTLYQPREAGSPPKE